MIASLKFIRTEIVAMAVMLVLMLLVTTAAASVLPIEPVATAEKGPDGQQKKPGGNGISSIDLYHSMEMGEQEKLESLGSNDDEDDSDKENGDSLLSMTSGGDDDSDIDQENLAELLTCMSCSGKLPAQWDADIDEQSYCLYDGGQPLTQNNGNVDEELYVCSGAVRCWKTKVREEDGFVRISRGCMGGGHGGGHRHSSQTNAELHPCMGAISNDLTTKNNDSSKQPRIWTSSHTFSSASAGQQLPPTYAIECCNGRDRCNDGPFPSLPGGDLSAIDDNGSLLAAVTGWWWLSIFVAALLFAVVIVATFTLKNRKRRKRSKSSNSRRSKRRNRSSTVDDDFLPPPYQRWNDNHQKDHQENDWTSGSGYGMPLLIQRTLAKQIQLRQLVGKGRYGEVWRATYWNGGHEQVAVKIFLSKDEPSWKRETEIYSTVLMRHDNILGFIGSDIMTSRNSYTTQLLLITHYHQHGSLYDFLQTPAALAAGTMCNGYGVDAIDTAGGRIQQIDRDRPPLTVRQMLNVLYTVASGLCHLHTEINGTQGNVKPVIAHRDIKSKNVLVKCAKTGACCVADFGMAVTSRDTTLPIQTTTAAGANQNTRVGTKRYMAPEVLDDSITTAAALALASASTTATTVASSSNFSTDTNDTPKCRCCKKYCHADMYSYALVMWEVLSRTLITPDIDDVGQTIQRPNDNQQQFGTDNRYNPYVYRAPYQDRGVGWDPGFDDMRRVVCSSDPEQNRPGVAAEWCANPITNAVVMVMQQCWFGRPSSRLDSMRVKKTLAKLIEKYSTIETEQQGHISQ